MQNTEQEYKDHIKELEQQIRLLKEQVDFLTRKLYGTKSEKTSALELEGQMSLFDEIESCADPDSPEPDLVEVETHLRKRKYAGQREKLVKNIPHQHIEMRYHGVVAGSPARVLLAFLLTAKQ